jgi:hypothetical protein
MVTKHVHLYLSNFSLLLKIKSTLIKLVLKSVDLSEEFEDTKCLIRIRIERQTKQWTKEKGQKDKQRSTKHYTEN